jgi:hypothetical protein
MNIPEGYRYAVVTQKDGEDALVAVYADLDFLMENMEAFLLTPNRYTVIDTQKNVRFRIVFED